MVFHASAAGRLTPESGRVKCLYLARTPNTSFYETYGDDVAAAKELGTTHTLSATEMKERVYATGSPTPTLHLYDLTTEGSAKKIGMDLATLYTAQVDHPRAFAQRLHDHPRHFDGILYTSRHTQGPCLVLWATYNPDLQKLVLTEHSRLWDYALLDPGLAPGQVKVFDDVIGVAAP
jgi:hypothetical protein